jgi:hypothetical protein
MGERSMERKNTLFCTLCSFWHYRDNRENWRTWVIGIPAKYVTCQQEQPLLYPQNYMA